MKKILMMMVCWILLYGVSACSDNNNEDLGNQEEQPNDNPSNPNDNQEGNKSTADGKITGLPNELSFLWGQGTTDEWDGTTDISWYDENKTAFQLTSAEQLAGLAELVNSGTTFARKTVKLTVNVILNKEIKFDAEGKVLNASELRKWIPIGRVPYYDNDRQKESFRGCFDGGYHIISGLYINTNENYSGLFGAVFSGYKDFNVVIKNVGIVSSYIRSTKYADAILCGIRTYENCRIEIENCFNTGVVIGEEGASGIGSATHIKHCFNRGIIKSEKGSASGIGSEASYCYNTGNIIAAYKASSIGGSKTNSYCYNIGIIEGKEVYYGGDKTCATLFQEEKKKTYKVGEVLFRDSIGKLYYHNPNGTLSITKPEDYSTLLECLNYGLPEDLLIWEIKPEKNNGYPIFIE